MDKKQFPHLKFLFLLKKGSTGYDNNYQPCFTNNLKVKSGLNNSANFVSNALNKYFGIETKVTTCIDGNSVDKEVHDYKPNICFIEAIWVTVDKMIEVSKLHPNVTFIVRIHSRTTFLANEGVAIERIKGYNKIPNVYVSFNNVITNCEFNSIGINSVYLPNVYEVIQKPDMKFIDKFLKLLSNKKTKKDIINIGCFGAIRPMKNQLLQGLAAIRFGEENNKIVRFHINATRTEQKGENVLKNLRSLFKDTKHELVEHGWMEHSDFLDLITTMDVGLQVSLSESFNIVTADFIVKKIPMIVSEEINWVNDLAKVKTDDSKAIADKIKEFTETPSKIVYKNLKALSEYEISALLTWRDLIRNYIAHTIEK
ncbi:MAG: hypothetical protein ABIP51_15095 [Bacteroidia bacterium]